MANGYWHARSIEFFRDHALIEWLRLPGDVLFIAGVVPLVYLTVRAVLRPRPMPAPDRPACESVESPLFREVAARTGSRGRPPAGGHAMNAGDVLLSLPADLEVWLLLGYAIVVLAGARLTESLARVHFERARRLRRAGLRVRRGRGPLPLPAGGATLAAPDRAGETGGRLPGAGVELRGCPRKAACTPHDEGRHIYRPLADWAETDVGRFHQWLSLLMFGVGAVLSLVGLVRWGGSRAPGCCCSRWRSAWPPCTRSPGRLARSPGRTLEALPPCGDDGGPDDGGSGAGQGWREGRLQREAPRRLRQPGARQEGLWQRW